MNVSVMGCLKQNTASRRQRKREKVALDMRQTVVESCALDGQGYAHEQRGGRT